MNCHDCDRIWNLLLDAEQSSPEQDATEPGDVSPELAAEAQRTMVHATGCTRCRNALAGYETLRQAVRTWSSTGRPPLAPPQALLDRVIAEQQAALLYRARWRWRVPAIAASASLAALLAYWLSGPSGLPRNAVSGPGPHGRSAVRIAASGHSSQGLRAAVLEATAATLDLARVTSEPAARLGRDMIPGSAPFDERPGGGAALPASVSTTDIGESFLAAVFALSPARAGRGDPSATRRRAVLRCPTAVVHGPPRIRIPAYSCAEKYERRTIPPSASKGA